MILVLAWAAAAPSTWEEDGLMGWYYWRGRELVQESAGDKPEGVAFLSAPYEGDMPVSNFFDHQTGEKRDEMQLTSWGEWLPGKANHYGYDFVMPVGTPILAAGDGVVQTAADQGPINCGTFKAKEHLRVRLKHAAGGEAFVTIYMHLSEILVEEGATVKAGDLIGKSGNTGCSTGPHLHFGVVRLDDPSKARGRSVDPFGWTGDGGDPRLEEGISSPYMWKPNQAPLMAAVRTRRPGNKKVAVGAFSAAAMGDDKDPNLEFVALVGPEQDVGGWQLRNNAGESFTLPAGSTVRPRGTPPLVVFSGVGDSKPRKVYMGRSEPLWDNGGDCIRVFDSAGKEIDSAKWGRKGHTFCDDEHYEDPGSE